MPERSHTSMGHAHCTSGAPTCSEIPHSLALTNRDVKPSGSVLRLCPAFCLREARWWLQLEVRKTSNLHYTTALHTISPVFSHHMNHHQATKSPTYLNNHSIITGDVNAHFTLWHSYTDDHRGELISETLSNSNHITLNTDTPTRVPNNAHQQPISPDITTISYSLYTRTTWKTTHTLNSDHRPILLTIETRQQTDNTTEQTVIH